MTGAVTVGLAVALIVAIGLVIAQMRTIERQSQRIHRMTRNRDQEIASARARGFVAGKRR